MNYRISPLILLLALAGVLLCGCAAKSDKTAKAIPPAPNTKPVESTQGYIINVPNDWTIIPKGTVAVVDMAAQQPVKLGSTFANNVNVVVEELPAQTSADDYCAKSKKMMKDSGVLPGFTEISTADFSGNAQGKKMVYTWKMGGQLPLKVCVYVFTNNSKGYVVTGTAQPATFAENEPVFDQIATSFRWK